MINKLSLDYYFIFKDSIILVLKSIKLNEK